MLNKDQNMVPQKIQFFKFSFFLLFSVLFFCQYFETDDPEFYKSKVCFVLNNDVSEMELVFAEEKYSKLGQLEKVRSKGLIQFRFLSSNGEKELCLY